MKNMKIDKALKKEKNSNRLFYLNMIILGVAIPVLAYLSSIRSTFILVYCAILEGLIISAILIRIANKNLKFTYYNSRLKIKTGLFLNESLILCNNVAIVHTNKYDYDLEIIIVTNSKAKNKRLRPVTRTVLKKYPEINQEYIKIRKTNPDNVFFYQVIRGKSLKKYLLLEKIYSTCVKAVYTPQAIESIKIARGQNYD